MKNLSCHLSITAGLVFALTSATSVQAQAIERELSDDGVWELRPVSLTPDPENPDGITDIPSPGASQIHRARQALAQGQTERARRLADDFIESNKNDPLVSEAYLVRAESLLRQKEYYKSLFDYEYICRMFPGSEAFSIALEQEFEIAKVFAAGKRRKFWGLRLFKAYDEAEELFIRIQERLPGSKLAERAARALADYYYDRREMALAATTYDVYLTNYPRATDHARAMQRLVFAHLGGYRGPQFDTSGLEEADGWLRILEDQHPAEAQQIGAGALSDRIDEARAEKLFIDAKWYLRRKDEVSGRFILNRLIKRHGTSLAAADAYRLMKERGWIDSNPPADDSQESSDARSTDSALAAQEPPQ